MPKPTYAYVSRGAPVIMRERVNGWRVAEYLAWPDRSGYLWKLYPYKLHVHLTDVPFTKKTIRASEAKMIDQPNPVPVKDDGKKEAPKEKSFPTSEQIKLF